MTAFQKTFAGDATGVAPFTGLTRAEQVLCSIPAIGMMYGVVVAPLLSFRIGAAAGATDTSDINSYVESGDSTNKVFWIALLLVAIVALVNARKFRPAINWSVIFTGLLIALAIASAAWSDHPDITLRRAFLQFCIAISMFAPFLAGLDPKTVLRRVAPAFYVAVFLSLLVSPTQLSEPLGVRGLYGQKNMLGQITGITVAFAAWDILVFRRFRAIKALAFVVALVLAVLSKSKTSEALVLFALLPTFFGFCLAKTHGASRTVAVTALLLLVEVVTAGLLMARVGLGDISLFIFGDSTFTNRTAIWEFCEQHIQEKPILGHGYGAFWGVGSDTASVAEHAGFISGLLQSHNGFIDISLALGEVGLALIWLMIIASYIGAIRVGARDTGLGLLSLYLLTFCYLNNSMESTLLRGYASIWLILLLIFGALASAGAKVRGPTAGNFVQRDRSARSSNAGLAQQS